MKNWKAFVIVFAMATSCGCDTDTIRDDLKRWLDEDSTAAVKGQTESGDAVAKSLPQEIEDAGTAEETTVDTDLVNAVRQLEAADLMLAEALVEHQRKVGASLMGLSERVTAIEQRDTEQTAAIDALSNSVDAIGERLQAPDASAKPDNASNDASTSSAVEPMANIDPVVREVAEAISTVTTAEKPVRQAKDPQLLCFSLVDGTSATLMYDEGGYRILTATGDTVPVERIFHKRKCLCGCDGFCGIAELNVGSSSLAKFGTQRSLSRAACGCRRTFIKYVIYEGDDK